MPDNHFYTEVERATSGVDSGSLASSSGGLRGGPAHRARPSQSRTAADQRGHRAGVVRGHERRRGEQRSVRREQPGHRVDRGDLQGLLRAQLGQQADHVQ